MKNIFIASKNEYLADHLLPLLRSVNASESWENATKLSKSTDVIIFDTESINFSEFPNYQKEIPIILFSHQIKPLIVQFTSKFYVNGIISYEMSPEEIRKTLDAVFAGDIFYTDGVVSMLFSNKLNDTAAKVASLTEREVEILLMMMKDMTNDDIADALDLSIRTVNAHKGNIMRKLGCKTTSGLVKMAIDYSAQLKTQL